MNQIVIAGLGKSFDRKPVLAGIDLAIASGDLVAILGPSGSGKTTLLRLICGFERADRGTIDVAGRGVAGPGLHLPPEQRHIGYVAQEGGLFPHLSVADNILFGLPRTRRHDRRRACELLELVGLPAAYGARGPSELSGGEQQRVALARALAPAPTLVLLDEPFSALDAALRAETRAAVLAALAVARATALLVTHDQSEALSMSQRVAVLRAGTLVQVAQPETLYRRPVDAELARFVGEAVVLPGVAYARRVQCALGDLALLNLCEPGTLVDVLVRPEQITLTTMESGALPARVGAVTYYGHDASVELRLEDDASTPVLVARVAGYRCPQPGALVGVAVDGAVMAYPR